MVKNILKNEYFYYFLTFIIIAIVLNIGVLHSPYIVIEDGELIRRNESIPSPTVAMHIELDENPSSTQAMHIEEENS